MILRPQRDSSKRQPRIPLLIIGLLTSACASLLKMPEDHQQTFLFGVEQQQADRYALSSNAAWKYVQEGGEEDPRYDRALRLLARNAESLGLNYVSSLWYLEVARGRRDVALIPEAISGLKDIIESTIYDEDALVNHFLAVEDFSRMTISLDSFIHYYQGLHDLRQGLDGWAKHRFALIHSESPYIYKARYVSAVRQVALGQLKASTQSFKRLLKDLKRVGIGHTSTGEEQNRPSASSASRHAASARQIHFSHSDLALLNEVWEQTMTSLARLAMQRGFEDIALTFFDRVREVVPDQPALLLEVAWAQYRRGDLRKALGYLLALDAPAYQGLIAPDRYILEALIYRSLCQFGPARQATSRLYARYKDALDDLYQGTPPERSKALRAAASLRGELRPMTQFIESLKRERALVKTLKSQLSPALSQALDKMYSRGHAAALIRREALLRREIDLLAEELLGAEEAVRLISHELSVALLRGRKPPAGRGPVPPVGEIARLDQALYTFKGEFWTDELDDLVIAAEDRCIDQ